MYRVETEDSLGEKEEERHKIRDSEKKEQKNEKSVDKWGVVWYYI